MTLPPVDPGWWRTLFDEVYLQTDARSVLDQEVTRAEVDGLVQALALQPGDALLDLCGGHGRHALELARRGYLPVTVLDYSHYLLALGRSQARAEGLQISFVRADARAVPLASRVFSSVALLANSFGYGATRDDDQAVLGEAARLIRPGGKLYLETADPEFVRKQLVPQSWHETPDGLVVCRRRWVTSEFLICRELVLSRERGLVREATYRMRLYGPEELRRSLKQAGFAAVRFAFRGSGGAERGSLSRRLTVVAVR
jgi:D-alanine-D-alanine ligase